MKISTRVRYGLRLMLALARAHEKGSIMLKDIARDEKISEKYLSQIIIPLRASGLVQSFRGAHGGYALSKTPRQITLEDIVEVLEGGIRLVDKVDSSSGQPVSVPITHRVWNGVASAISRTLGSTTLQDLVEQYDEVKNGKVIMYNI